MSGDDKSGSESSCFPPDLEVVKTYTDGISDGLTPQINRLGDAISTYLTNCHPSYSPDPSVTVYDTDNWRSGLVDLGNWTNSVALAFLAADQAGDYGPRGKGGAFDWVYDNAIVDHLPSEWKSTPYLGVSGGQLLDWDKLEKDTDGNPEKAFMDLVSEGASKIANDPANQLAADAKVYEVLADNKLVPEDMTELLERDANLIDGAGDVVAAVEGFQDTWNENTEKGNVSLPVNVMTSTLHAWANVTGGLVGGAIGAASCGPAAPVCAVLGVAFGGYLSDVGISNLLSGGPPSTKEVTDAVTDDKGLDSLDDQVNSQAYQVAQQDAGSQSYLPGEGTMPLLAGPLYDPSQLYPVTVPKSPELPFPWTNGH